MTAYKSIFTLAPSSSTHRDQAMMSAVDYQNPLRRSEWKIKDDSIDFLIGEAKGLLFVTDFDDRVSVSIVTEKADYHEFDFDEIKPLLNEADIPFFVRLSEIEGEVDGDHTANAILTVPATRANEVAMMIYGDVLPSNVIEVDFSK